MSTTNEVIDEEDVVAMELDELKKTSAEIDVDPETLGETIPTMSHHMTVRGKLEALVEQGALTYDEMDEVYGLWDERK